MHIEVIYAAGVGIIHRYRLEMAAEADCGSAIMACGVLRECPEIDFYAGFGIAIYGRRASWRTRLADGDRVEILRALQCDPKEARRLRARGAVKSIN